ncbi:protein of unknown function [Magnetospirillum sp. XM-1]|uniref:hypothetical protein n=1 Tax=Magnetospirillum sp. XM-1 TaxID=1663591 RepID=UPI00073DF4CD|nr:hypothetical protein [Magnetospirillum sp. XM-1]CUW38883.1 protein of unknown function [Magnetospirillum sp. XM-1]
MLDNTAVYQVNLDHRTDRWQQCQENHAAMGFESMGIQRVSAAYEQGYAHLGCTKSHLKAYTRFLTEDSRDYVMVLEDDFDFRISRDELAQRMAFLESTGKDWDAVLLTASQINGFATEHPGLGRVFESLTTAGYITRRTYVPKLIEIFVESLANLEKFRRFEPRDLITSRFASDVLWQRLQRADNWFVFVPAVGEQRPSYSDAMGGYVDYRSISI